MNGRNMPSSSNRQSSSDQDEIIDSEDYDKYDASAVLVKKNPLVPGLGFKGEAAKKMDGLCLDLGNHVKAHSSYFTENVSRNVNRNN